MTTATFSTAGSYVLKLTASDSVLTASANITVTVNAAASGACAGLCTSPTVFTMNGNYQSGNLGTGAVCYQTTSVIHGGNCSNFASPRTLKVNGTTETCGGGNWPHFLLSPSTALCLARFMQFVNANFTTAQPTFMAEPRAQLALPPCDLCHAIRSGRLVFPSPRPYAASGATPMWMSRCGTSLIVTMLISASCTERSGGLTAVGGAFTIGGSIGAGGVGGAISSTQTDGTGGLAVRGPNGNGGSSRVDAGERGGADGGTGGSAGAGGTSGAGGAFTGTCRPGAPCPDGWILTNHDCFDDQSCGDELCFKPCTNDSDCTDSAFPHCIVPIYRLYGDVVRAEFYACGNDPYVPACKDIDGGVAGGTGGGTGTGGLGGNPLGETGGWLGGGGVSGGVVGGGGVGGGGGRAGRS